MDTGLDPRRMRGMEIAATVKIVQKGGAWIVPSQSGKGRYTVRPDEESPLHLSRSRDARRQVQAHLRG